MVVASVQGWGLGPRLSGDGFGCHGRAKLSLSAGKGDVELTRLPAWPTRGPADPAASVHGLPPPAPARSRLFLRPAFLGSALPSTVFGFCVVSPVRPWSEQPEVEAESVILFPSPAQGPPRPWQHAVPWSSRGRCTVPAPVADRPSAGRLPTRLLADFFLQAGSKHRPSTRSPVSGAFSGP